VCPRAPWLGRTLDGATQVAAKSLAYRGGPDGATAKRPPCLHETPQQGAVTTWLDATNRRGQLARDDPSSAADRVPDARIRQSRNLRSLLCADRDRLPVRTAHRSGSPPTVRAAGGAPLAWVVRAGPAARLERLTSSTDAMTCWLSAINQTGGAAGRQFMLQPS